MLVAWKNVEQLHPEIKERKPEIIPRQRLVVGVEGVQAGTPAPPGMPALRVLFILEEEQARLLGVDLEVFPEEPVRVKINLEII